MLPLFATIVAAAEPTTDGSPVAVAFSSLVSVIKDNALSIGGRGVRIGRGAMANGPGRPRGVFNVFPNSSTFDISLLKFGRNGVMSSRPTRTSSSAVGPSSSSTSSSIASFSLTSDVCITFDSKDSVCFTFFSLCIGSATFKEGDAKELVWIVSTGVTLA